MARHVVVPEPGGAPAEPVALPPPSVADRWYEVRDRVARAPGAAVVVLVAALVVAASAWWLVRPGSDPLEQVLPRASAAGGASGSGAGAAGDGTTSASGTVPGGGAGPGGAGAAATPADAAPTELVAQASGAVERPGVYRLPADARVDDLVRRAGGLAPDADLDRINLAAPVADGTRVWLARHGEGDPPEVVGQTAAPAQPFVTGAGGGGAAGATAGPAAPVNLNTADADQLDTLPGVGPATATAILSYRTEHGSFSSVEELLEVRGIGDAKLEQLRPLVAV